MDGHLDALFSKIFYAWLDRNWIVEGTNLEHLNLELILPIKQGKGKSARILK
jgi:hypothetical protein